MYHLSLLWCNHFLLLFVWLIASFTPSPFVASSVLVLFLSTGGSWDQIWPSGTLRQPSGSPKGAFWAKTGPFGGPGGAIPDICHKYHKWDVWGKFVMCRNFRFLYMTDVETSEMMLFAIYAILLRICCVAIYALLCGEQLSPNCMWRKITNIRF